MERWMWKCVAVIAVFILPLLCTLLPLKVFDFFERKGDFGKKIISCLMCFGGGVFFATYILHMGPEVREILKVSLLEPNNITYPVADLIMAFGFFMVLFIEKIVLKANKHRKKLDAQKKQRNCLEYNKNGPNENGIHTEEQAKRLAEQNPDGSIPVNIYQRQQVNNDSIQENGKPADTAAVNECPLLGTGECCKDPEEVKVYNVEEEDANFINKYGDEAHTHVELELLVEAKGTRALILLLALSLHRIFEGMSVGLQRTTYSVWGLFAAVMCHETVIGFSLGLEFVKKQWKVKRIIIIAVLCSSIMPVGVVIGTLLFEVGHGQSVQLEIVNGVLQGIATGTFIYVTFFEILGEEITPHDSSLAKMFSVLGGFLLMALLSLVPEEDTSMIVGHDVLSTPMPVVNLTDSGIF